MSGAALPAKRRRRKARVNLASIDFRRKLPKRKEPYWQRLARGVVMGYRSSNETWHARLTKNEKREKRLIGDADTFRSPDGETSFTYRDACKRALAIADEEESTPRAGLVYTVADAMRDYLDYARPRIKSSRETERVVETRILPELGKIPVEKLTAKRIETWLSALATSRPQARPAIYLNPETGSQIKRLKFREPAEDQDEDEQIRKRRATANRTLTVLKAALSHAFREGHVDVDRAWRRVKPYREVDAARVRYLSTDEARRLVNGCAQDFRPLVRGALLSGCRYGELVTLRCEDYSSDSGSIRIRTSKAGKSRSVPLTEEGVELLESLTAGRQGTALVFPRADGKPWGVSHQARRMETACTAAKLDPPVRFHELRHTYGSMLAQRGVSLQVIAEVLGHADTRMTMKHYAHLMPSYVAETVRANLPRLSRKKPAGKVRRIR